MTLLLDRPSQQALVDLKRVLIIDDEEPIRRLLGYMLQSHGYETVLASDAREARLRLAETSFALMLCDVNMPGESGMDLVRSVLRQHPHTAAIMVTGLDSPVLANAALDMGAFGYIIKPFESNEVLINVANALRRRRLEMENRLHRENLEDVVRTRTMALQQALEWLEQEREGTPALTGRNHSTAGHRRRIPGQCHSSAYSTHESLLRTAGPPLWIVG